MKPFVTNKGTHRNEEYILQENGGIQLKFLQILMNTTQTLSKLLPVNLLSITLSSNNDVIDDILSYYQDHSSVRAIQEKHDGKKINIYPQQ